MPKVNKVILISHHSLNLSFPLLLYVISTAIPKFSLNSLHFHPNSPHFFYFTTQIPYILTLISCISISISFLTFQPLFSAFSLFRSLFGHFGFYKETTQFVISKNLFQENSCLSSKANTLLCNYCISLSTNIACIIYVVIIVISKIYLPCFYNL